MKYLFALLLVLCSPTIMAANLVTHNEQVRVDRAMIRLGDVFAGLAIADDVEIAIAPAAGKSVSYDYSVLSKLAQRYTLNWQANSLNDKTIITRAAQKISAEMIRAAIIDKLKTQGISGEIDVVLDQRGLELNLPTDANTDFTLHDFRVDKGSMRFTTHLMAALDTPAFQQVAVTGRATAVIDVPVLNKALSAGTVIGASDLAWIKLPLDRANDFVRTTESLVGRELKRQMPEQAALKLQDVLPARLVLRGSLVTMQVVMPSMTLTAQGRALQDGALGDVIRMTNTQSNRVVEAKVTAAGTAEIMLTAQLASLQ